MDWDALRAGRSISRRTSSTTSSTPTSTRCRRSPTWRKRIRRIGLGVMGFADAVRPARHPLRLRRGRRRSAGKMHAVRGRGGEEASRERLADERGAVPRVGAEHLGPGRDLRARRRTASASARCSGSGTATSPPSRRPARSRSSPAARSGIEPLFAVAFMRNQAGVLMPDVNEDFVAIAKREGWYSDDADASGSPRRGTSTSPRCRRSGSGCSSPRTHITPEWHIRMQAAFQEHSDSAISQDHQLRPRRDRGVRRGDLRAGVRAELQGRDGLPRRQPRHAGALDRRHGEEGARAGDRRRQVRGAGGPAGDRGASAPSCTASSPSCGPRSSGSGRWCYELEAENLQRRQKRSRPELLRGTTRRMETPLGTLYVTITEDDRGQPFEVFMSLGKAGGALMADVEAMGRLISPGAALGDSAQGDLPPAARHQLRPGDRPRARTRCCRCRMRSASRSSGGCRRSRASSRSCCRARRRQAEPAPVVAQRSAVAGLGGEQIDARRHAGDAVGRVSRTAARSSSSPRGA